MESVFTFDVLVLSGKSSWTSVSRWENPGDARIEAQKLVSSRKYAGIKVVQEHFDAAENRFLERTIFKHLKNDGTDYYEDSDREFQYVPYRDFDTIDGKARAFLVLGVAVAVIAVLLAVGLFLVKTPNAVNERARAGYFVYDLPVVMTNIATGEKTFSLKVKLQLELGKREDSKAVELALAQVMESVIDQLQMTDAGRFRKEKDIESLRAILKEKIQNAVGETRVDGILFKQIEVY